LRIALTGDSATSTCGLASYRPEFRRQICQSDLKGCTEATPDNAP